MGTCLMCGVSLIGRPRHARTCSARCRQRLSRQHRTVLLMEGVTPARAKCDTPAYDQVVRAEALAYLRSLPAACVDLCITSPPYWAKRTYSTDPRELGQERSPEEYLARMVAICTEVRRVLKPSGWFLLNVADTYSNQPGRGRGSAKRAISPAAQRATASAPDKRLLDRPVKCKTQIPERLALRLVDEAGFWHRNTITWVKVGHQPEHLNDRLTQASEPILVLSAGARSYYARDAHATANDTDVWELPVGRRRGAGNGHPAVFPDALVERAIRRFCPPGGVVLDCFAGSGTVLDVAQRMGRRFLGCDLIDWRTDGAAANAERRNS